MPKIFLGNLSAIRYLGNEEKEFNRSPFTPKPIVKNGDIIILEKIHAHNLSKLLPTEFEMINDNFLNIETEDELLEIIAEFEAEVKELEAVVAAHDLKLSSDEALNTSLKPLEEFATKEELLTYAIEEFGFELDKDLELEDMYKSLEEITISKEDK